MPTIAATRSTLAARLPIRCGDALGLAAVWLMADEPVAALGQGRDEAEAACRVVQGLAQLANRLVHAVVEVDRRLIGPERLADRLSGHDLGWLGQQQCEDVEGLLLERQSLAGLPQCSCV